METSKCTPAMQEMIDEIGKEGWETLELKDWAYRYGVPSYRYGWKKGNFWLILDTRLPHIEIVAEDVNKIDWMPEFPEKFRVTLPCKDINTFKFITNLLGV
jgi:hypothetical protein